MKDLLAGLLADQGRSGNYGDESYDRIDELVDSDPIALAQRYRIALGMLSDPVRTAIETGQLEEDGVWADPDDAEYAADEWGGQRETLLDEEDEDEEGSA